MDFRLRAAVWEITMACNMRCKHCGSSCQEKLPGELTTEEALCLCEELSDLGLEIITLSGGEPTTRADWYIIAGKLSELGIKTSIITNGWLTDEAFLEHAKQANIHTATISIDGMKETHDLIRKQGSFEKDIRNLEIINGRGIYTAVITTVNKKNIGELEDMYRLFSNLGVTVWQLQIAMPMGNFKSHQDMFLAPQDVDDIVDFAYERLGRGVKIAFADCIGYYNKKAMAIAQNHIAENWCWQGCGAGKHSMGILHNGDITACTSLRGNEFIVGNIRERSLADIWNDQESFAWNRQLKKEQLKGLCSKCQYGTLCLGGCSNSRLCMNGSIYSENKFCSYNNAVSNFERNLSDILEDRDENDLLEQTIEKKEYQLAEIILNKILEKVQDIKYLEMYAFVNFELENDTICRSVNEKILELEPSNAYALKGLGLVCLREGDADKGLAYLYRAVEINQNKNVDIYFDLFVVLKELGFVEKMEEIYCEAQKCQDFPDAAERFDQYLSK